jgi:hypothetical protein
MGTNLRDYFELGAEPSAKKNAKGLKKPCI